MQQRFFISYLSRPSGKGEPITKPILNKMKGKLYLIPTFLGNSDKDLIPEYNKNKILERIKKGTAKLNTARNAKRFGATYGSRYDKRSIIAKSELIAKITLFTKLSFFIFYVG